MSMPTARQLRGSLRSARATARFLLHSARFRSLYRYVRGLEAGRESGKRIIIHSGRRQEHGIVSLETFLAACLLRLGARPRVVLDDTVSDYWDGMLVDSAKESFDIRFRPWVIQRLLGARRSSLMVTYTQLLGAEEIERLERLAAEMAQRGRFEFEGIDLWPHIESSLVRYFRSAPSLMTGYADYPRALRGYTRNALVSAAAARRAIAALEPDCVISSHAAYASWGPFMEIVRTRGIGAVTYGLTGMMRNAVSFTRAALPSLSMDDGYFGANHHRIAMEVAGPFATRVLDDRASGGRLAAGAPRTASGSRLMDELDRRFADRKVFGLFPNLMWEFECIPQIAGVFRTREEWLIRTVEYFMQRPAEGLIIRAHPWETSRSMLTTDGAERLLRQHLGARVFECDNIVFVPPSDPTSSYRLFPRLKAGIVHTGTLGLELIYAGIPSIVAGLPGYASQPFVRRYDSPEAYFAAFDELDAIRRRQDANRDLFLKYVYYYFQLAYVPVPQLDTLLHARLGAAPPAPDALASDPELLAIAGVIVNGGEFADLRLAAVRG